jgi:hypothetical protein
MQPDDFEKGANEDVEKEKTSEADESGSGKDQQDVVFIQDVGFTVTVAVPNVEAFEIQVMMIAISY